LGFPHDVLDFKIKKVWDELEREKVDGLNEVISEIIQFKEIGFYEKLLDKLGINRTGFRRTINFGKSLKIEEMKKVPIINLGYENLSNPFIFFPEIHDLLKKDLIIFLNIYFMYKFMEAVYFMNIDRMLENEDLIKLYFSGLDRRIIFALDKFDEVSEVPEPTTEFFLKLKALKWKKKSIKGFFNKLNKVRADFLYKNRKSQLYSNPTFPPIHKIRTSVFYAIFFPRTSMTSPYTDFSITENLFILFLAACSAVDDNRGHINENDVIRAYITYYKLLKTDISRIVDKLWEEKSEDEDNGYLVCDRCQGYYKLQLGESPEDFSDECECGGRLNYYDNIDWVIKEGE